MTDISDRQISELLEDIASIKTTVRKSRGLLQQIFLVRPFKLLGVLAGTAIITFSLTFHFLLAHFGSHQAIPFELRVVLYAAIGVVWVMLGVLKNASIWRSAKRVDANVTYWTIWRQWMGGRLMHFHIPIFGVIIAFLVLFIVRGQTDLIVPLLSLGIGTAYLGYAGLLHAGDFYVAGYWLLFTGFLVVALSSIPPLVALSITLGFGFLIMGLVSYLHPPVRQE